MLFIFIAIFVFLCKLGIRFAWGSLRAVKAYTDYFSRIWEQQFDNKRSIIEKKLVSYKSQCRIMSYGSEIWKRKRYFWKKAIEKYRYGEPYMTSMF